MCVTRNLFQMTVKYILGTEPCFKIFVTKVYSVSIEISNKNFETLVIVLLFSAKMVPCHVDTKKLWFHICMHYASEM